MACPIHSHAQQRNELDEPLKLSAELVVVDAQVLSKARGYARVHTSTKLFTKLRSI